MLTKRRGKLGRAFAIFMVVCLLVTYSGVSAFAGTDGPVMDVDKCGSCNVNPADYHFVFTIIPEASTDKLYLSLQGGMEASRECNDEDGNSTGHFLTIGDRIVQCDIYLEDGFGTSSEIFIGSIDALLIGHQDAAHKAGKPVITADGSLGNDGVMGKNTGNKFNLWLHKFEHSANNPMVKFDKIWINEDGQSIQPENGNQIRFAVSKIAGSTGSDLLVGETHADGYATFAPGTRTVQEVIPEGLEKYSFKSVTIKEPGKTAITLPVSDTATGAFEYKFNAGVEYLITYTNECVDTVLKNITIKKEAVEGETGIEASEEFPFYVAMNFPGDFTADDFEFEGADDVTGTAEVAGLFPGADAVYKVILNINEEYTFSGLPRNVNYEIVEKKPVNYLNPSVEYDTETSLNLEAPVSYETNAYVGISGVAKADATYTFKNDKLVPGIDVEKAIISGDEDKVYAVGNTIEYEIVIRNTGDLLLTDFVLTEMEDFLGPFDAQGNPVTMPTSLPVGYVGTVYYQYVVTETSPTTVENIVVVTATGGGIKVTDEDGKDAPVAHPNLSVVKEIWDGSKWIETDSDSPFEIANEQEIQFRVTVYNDGAVAANGVKLTDVFEYDDGVDITLSPNPAGVTFDVPGKSGNTPGEDSQIFTATVYGKNADAVKEYAAQLVNNIAEVEQDIQDSLDGAGVDSTEAAIEAWTEQKNLVSEDRRAALDANPEADTTTFDERIAELNNAIQGLRGLETTLAQLNKELEDLGDGKIPLDLYTFAENNATVTYKKYTPVSSKPVYVKIKPEVEVSATMVKEIWDADNEVWTNLIELDSWESKDIDYRITITNTGTETIYVTLNDILQVAGVNEKLIEDASYTILPGESEEITYTFEVPANTAFEGNQETINTAMVSYHVEGGDDIDLPEDSTTVITPPQPYVGLSIDKQVWGKVGDGMGWKEFSSIYSDTEENTFKYKITIREFVGKMDATFTLSDSMLANDATIYTDEAMTQAASIGQTFNVTAAGEISFYYEITYTGYGEHKNVVTVETENPTPYDPDDDTVPVDVEKTPTIKLSVSKEVMTVANFEAGQNTWSKTAKEANVDGKGNFIFKLTIKNEVVAGDPAGYAATFDLTDAMPIGDGTCTFVDSNGKVIAPEDLKTLSIGANGEDTIYLYAKEIAVGTYVNTVSIGAIQTSNPDVKSEIGQETDTATITVEKTEPPVKPWIELVIIKEVKDSDGVWKEAANYRGSSAVVSYRITVKAIQHGTMGDFEISGSIKDTLAKDLKINDVPFDWSFTLSNEIPSKTFNYDLAISGRGEHPNTASIDKESLDYNSEEFDVRVGGPDSANVTLRTRTPGPGPDPDPDPTPISDELVPLAETPVIKENPVVLVDPEVPLADIPQTGVEDMSFNLMMLGISLSALLAVLFGRKRSTTAKKENI